MMFWVIGFIIAVATLAVYLEYTAYFPNRSGSKVVYLEQAFPKPEWLFPTTLAILSVLLSFSSPGAIGQLRIKASRSVY
jgi:quinol-cytochrome oxidoreductase complex cytochrome b subunit